MQLIFISFLEDILYFNFIHKLIYTRIYFIFTKILSFTNFKHINICYK